jgi:hypothetical protein
MYHVPTNIEMTNPKVFRINDRKGLDAADLQKEERIFLKYLQTLPKGFQHYISNQTHYYLTIMAQGDALKATYLRDYEMKIRFVHYQSFYELRKNLIEIIQRTSRKRK